MNWIRVIKLIFRDREFFREINNVKMIISNISNRFIGESIRRTSREYH